jgi:hypothetical protein
MAEKRLSDEEILRMIEEFEFMTPEEKSANFLGKGSLKTTYKLPNSDYVIKNPRYREDDLIKDYITHKQLAKTGIPTEVPILIKRPDKKAVLIQRRLSAPEIEDVQALENKANSKFLKHTDIHADNVGLDEAKTAKVFDSGPFVESWRTSDTMKNSKGLSINDLLEKPREAAAKKIINLKSPKIYRSIPLVGPAIGAGLAALSGEANAASALPILGEADSLGPEQGMEDYEIENPQANPAARRAALNSILKK